MAGRCHMRVLRRLFSLADREMASDLYAIGDFVVALRNTTRTKR